MNMPVKFTQAQLDFVRKEYPGRTRKELTKLFNTHFDTERSVNQITSFVKNHKIRSGLTGRFVKGQKSWNSGTKGIMKPNSGSFIKGLTPYNLTDIGTERICSREGYILIKTEEVNAHTKHNGFYRHKHVVIWEKENGKVPNGMVVRFKDGDKLNVCMDNLELVTRALNLQLNKNALNDAPKEIKPTIRAISELEVKMFKRLG